MTKYTTDGTDILKDGHVMFVEDVVKDLEFYQMRISAAVRGAVNNRCCGSAWGEVTRIFCTGSHSARQLCIDAGVDPDDVISFDDNGDRSEEFKHSPLG